MTTREEAFAAKRLIEDDTFKAACSKLEARLIKNLLAATTPEDRESKYQEISGLKRLVNDLELTARDAQKFAP